MLPRPLVAHTWGARRSRVRPSGQSRIGHPTYRRFAENADIGLGAFSQHVVSRRGFCLCCAAIESTRVLLLGCSEAFHQRHRALRPEFIQGADEVHDVSVRVVRRRHQPQTFGAPRHCRIVDRLHLDAIAVEQDIRQRLAADGIGDKDRHNMARARHHRDIGDGERRF